MEDSFDSIIQFKLTSAEVEKYLKRIGYCGTLTPNLKNLQILCEKHVMSVPEDTLDLFGGKPKIPDLRKIYEDVVENERGGFCYEVNGLFGSLLRSLSYNVYYIEGSYYMTKEDEFCFPFNHMLLKVILQGEVWIVDVGFGAPSFLLPLKLNVLEPHEQLTGIFRLREAPVLGSHQYYVEKYVKTIRDLNTQKEKINRQQKLSKYAESEDWNIVFRFSSIPHTWEDFHDAFNKTVDDENGFFRTNSFLQIFTETGAVILWGSKLIEKEFPDARTENIRRTEMLKNVNDEEEKTKLKLLMKQIFGVQVPFEPQLKSREYGSGLEI